MPNTPNFIHGKLGTITINSSLFYAEQYDFEEYVVDDLQDITYCVAGGATYQVLLAGYNGVNGTITFVYDINNQPTVAPYNMIPGTPMTLLLQPDGTQPYSFNGISGRFRWGSGPKAGVVRVTVPVRSTGTVTHPTANA